MEKITFDQLPVMVALILEKLERIEAILKNTNKDLPQNRDMLTAIETAKFMGISMSLLYKLTSAREIATFKPNGKKLYFKRSDLEDWMSRNRISPNQDIEQKALDYVAQNPLKL